MIKLNQNSIFQLLKSAYPGGLSVKEILMMLSLGANKRTQLRKILRHFSQKKICHKSNNKYFLSPQFSDLNSLEKEKTSRRKKGVPQERSEIGVWIYHNNKGYIQSPEPGTKLELISMQATSLIHGDVVRYRILPGSTKNQKVELVAILKRRLNKLHGLIEKRKKSTVLIPTSDHFHHVFELKGKVSKQTSEQEGSWIEISKYPQRNIPPVGKLIPSLTEYLNEKEEIKNIFSRNSLEYITPVMNERETEALPRQVRLNKKEARTDLRDLPFITIDGADARDFDDAIYAEQKLDGYRIWVSIADVSHYVKEGSNIDQQAQLRANSIYLPDKAYPMLPEALSNDLCSLISNKNRYTITCEIELTSDGEVTDFKVYESLIKVFARLTYQQVDQYFETDHSDVIKNKNLKEQLKTYLVLAKKLRQKRLDRGMINFSLPETRYEFDKDNHIIGIHKHFQSDGQKLIEQFMLEANEAIAHFCHNEQIPIIWRNHVEPISNDIEQIKELLWSQQIKKNHLMSGVRINQILAQNQDSEFSHLIDKIILKTMSQARYDTFPQKHFGLGANFYCHFTSPIRRYADLIVHRSIIKFLKTGTKLKIDQSLADHLSLVERNAVKAEREASKLKNILFIFPQLGKLFTATITGMLGHGLYVTISDPYIEGFMPLESVLDDFYLVDLNSLSLKGKKSKKQYTIGQKILVQLTQIDMVNLSPEFEWICWK